MGEQEVHLLEINNSIIIPFKITPQKKKNERKKKRKKKNLKK